MVLQTLHPIRKQIQKHFRKYPNSGIFNQFKKYRSDNKYSLIGDYPLLSFIVRSVSELGINFSKTSFRKAFNCSSELKGQKSLQQSLRKDVLEISYRSNLSPKASLFTSKEKSHVK